MNHITAGEYAQQGAELISRLLRSHAIPPEDRSEACDIAIDLNNLAKHHTEAAEREAPTAGAATP